MEENNSLKIVSFEKFYKAINPNITTTKSGILYFNSSNEEEDNAAPQKLKDLKSKSSIHSLFLELKSSLIATKSGLYPVDDSNSKLIEFLKSKNRAGSPVQKIFKKCAADMATYEQCFIEVIYNGAGKIAELYHKPVNTMRMGEPNEYGAVEEFYYSNTWGDVTNKKDKKKRNNVAEAVVIPAFNPENGASDGSQILHIKKTDCDDGEYPIPSYMAAEFWINVVWAIGSYVLNKFEGGYFLDGFLYLNADMPKEKQDEFVRDFRNKHQGTKGNKVVFVFGNDNIKKPEFVPIGDTLGNAVFKEYMGEATKQIVFAHGGSLELLSLSNSDSFGSTNPDSNDINVSRMKYVNDVIVPYQEVLLEGFNSIFEVNGLGEATVLNETLKLTIPELQPADTTVDERREIVLGLNPLSQPVPVNENENV